MKHIAAGLFFPDNAAPRRRQQNTPPMKKTLTCLLLLAPLLLHSCHTAQRPAAADSTYIFRDDYGASIAVPAAPQRVVSASPAVTEIICDLGCLSRLAGRTDFCHYPPQAQKVESIGGISNLNIEKILSLKPDLVISGSMVPQGSVNRLNALGVPMVCVTEQPAFDSLFASIRKIGTLMGVSSRADSLCSALRQRLENATRSRSTDTAAHPRPKVYYCVGYGKGGNFTAGGNTYINDIIRMAGAQNIAENVKGWSYSMEALFNADPDYVIIRKEDKDAFEKTPPYNRLRAVKQGHVIPIESGMMDLQVPRNIDAIEQLSRALGTDR